jgi:hypothetical protein
LENLSQLSASKDLQILPPSSKLEKALQGQKLVECGNEPLAQALRRVMLMLGIRPQNQPTQVDFDFLKGFVVQQFGANTPDEIVLAFEMAIAGRLPDLKSEDVNCYENFSCAYVGRIMSHYRAWAIQQIKDLQWKRKQIEVVDEKPPQVTDWLPVWESVLNDYEKGKKTVLLPYLYDWLKDSGHIHYTRHESAGFVKKALATWLEAERSEMVRKGEDYSNWVLLEALQKASLQDLGIVKDRVKAKAKVLALEDYIGKVLALRNRSEFEKVVDAEDFETC